MAQENPRRDGRMPQGTQIAILIVLTLIVIGIYVFRTATGEPPQQEQMATASSTTVDRAGERLPAGSDPQPTFDSTREEIEHRGGGETPQGPMPRLGSTEPVTRLSEIADDRRPAEGQRVELTDVEVESANGNLLSIKDGNDRAMVVAPDSTSVRSGQHVDVSGRVETTDGSVRIVATRIVAKD